jgi:hypothetical protein
MSRRPGAQSCACRRRSLGLVVLAAALAMWNLGCNVVNSGGPTGSGRVISDTRTVSRFSAIELRGVGGAVVTLGGPEALIVEAEDNLLPSITTTVSNDTLVVELKTGRPTKPIVYHVTARELTALTTSGAGDIEANGLTASRLRTSQNGAGDIRLGQLTAQELASSMSGAGSLHASGTVGTLTLTMAGAGKLNGRELAVRDARLTITGAGDATVRVSDTLRAQLTGAGSVAYIGNPRVESNITGAGSVRRIES